MWMRSVRQLVGPTWRARAWRPEHARLIWSSLVRGQGSRGSGLTEGDHLKAAVEWLCRAQDVMRDGGVCGRYALDGGWSSSYPETTGYIIPTFLALAQEFHDARFEERAARAVRFLLAVQLPDGAFASGEVEENTVTPSVFNTAQILGGLTAWHRLTGDPRALEAADHAAEWLVSAHESDGTWRRHLYEGLVTTYSAQATCWLAEFGAYRGVRSCLDAAERHLDWVLAHQDLASGWFDLAGFTSDDHAARRAVTHTIGYTLWGVLYTSEILRRSDGVVAVAKAAGQIARRLELTGWLPGVLDERWRGRARYACLTGNAQLALVWLRLCRHTHSAELLGAACTALDLVARAQPMFANDPDIRGGIPGSAPIWGGYLRYALPNWAAKFFIDALLEKKRAVADLCAPSAPNPAARG